MLAAETGPPPEGSIAWAFQHRGAADYIGPSNRAAATCSIDGQFFGSEA